MAIYTAKSMNGSSFPPDLPELHRSTNALVKDMLELELLISACENQHLPGYLNADLAK
jgi:hypothetical protein